MFSLVFSLHLSVLEWLSDLCVFSLYVSGRKILHHALLYLLSILHLFPLPLPFINIASLSSISFTFYQYCIFPLHLFIFYQYCISLFLAFLPFINITLLYSTSFTFHQYCISFLYPSTFYQYCISLLYLLFSLLKV